MRFVIVASGPSAKGFVPPDGAVVIAVNGAITQLPRADHWFTLDPSESNMALMKSPAPGVRYWAAVADSCDIPAHVTRLKRLSVPVYGLKTLNHGSPGWWLRRLSCKTGLSDDPKAIHTGNSAWGALGLAKHLGAERVALVGVDASDEERTHGGRSRNLSHLPLLFSSAVGQIDFVSCGKMSGHGIKQMTIQEGMEWLTS